MPEATFTADALVASYFHADAVKYGTRTTPFTMVIFTDDFDRTEGPPASTLTNLRWESYGSYWNSAASSQSYIANALRVPATRYDSFGLGSSPFDLPAQGAVSFDFRVPAAADSFEYSLYCDRHPVYLDRYMSVGAYYYGGTLEVWAGDWSVWDSITPEADATYRVKATWSAGTLALWCWKVSDPEPGPLVVGTNDQDYARYSSVADNVLYIWDAPATEDALIDNLTITTTFFPTADAVVGKELVRDTFTRTTTPPAIIGSDDLGNPWTLIPGSSWPGTDYLEYVDGSELVLPPTAEIWYGIGPRFSTGSVRLDCYLEATGDSYIDLRVGGASGAYGGYVTVYASQLSANGDTYIYDVPFTTGWYTVEVYADGSDAPYNAPSRRFRMRHRDTGVEVFDLAADYSTLFDPYGIVLYVGNYSSTKTVRIDNVGAWRTSPTITYGEAFTASAVLIKTMTGMGAAEAPSSSLWAVENTSSSNSSNATVSLGGGAVVPGDLLVAVIARRISSTSTVTFTAPTGWELAYSGVSTDPTSTYSRIALAIWIRTASGTGNSGNFGATVTSGGTNLLGFMEAFRGSGGPWYLYDAATVTQIVNTVGDTAQVVATLRAKSLAVVAAAADVSSALTTIPSPFSQRDRATTSLSAGYGTYANPTDGVIDPTITWNVATGVARSAVLLSITGRAPGFTADAVLSPGEGGTGSFTAAAYVQFIQRTGSFTASALKLTPRTFPSLLSRIPLVYQNAIPANNQRSVSASYSSTQQSGYAPLMYAAVRLSSGVPTDQINPYGGSALGAWRQISTAVDPDRRIRVWVFIGEARADASQAYTYAGVSYLGPTTPASISVIVTRFMATNWPPLLGWPETSLAQLIQTTETPLDQVTIPAISLNAQGHLEAYSTVTRVGTGSANQSTPTGFTGDGSVTMSAGGSSASWRPVTPVPGPSGPLFSTIASPDSDVMSRITHQVAILGPGGISVSAELLEGVRLYASLTANAVLKSQLAATQQHPRDDHFHVGATPADMVLTSVAIGPWPIGSVLQEVLEWLWGQYGYHSSVNQRWAAFTASAVRFGTQSRALSAAASFIQLGAHVFPANAVVRSTQDGATFANAWIYSQSVDIVEGFLFADAEFVFPPIVWADAIITRALEADFTASALALRSSGASLAADAFVQPYFRADATLVGLDGLFLYLDAVLLGSQSSSISTDAVLHMTGTSSFTADSARRKPQESSLAADSLFTQTAAGSLAGDAVLLVTTSAATQVDASISNASVQNLTADATITVSMASSLTGDAVIDLAWGPPADGSNPVASYFHADAVIAAESSTITFDDTLFDSTYFE